MCGIIIIYLFLPSVFVDKALRLYSIKKGFYKNFNTDDTLIEEFFDKTNKKKYSTKKLLN